MSRNFAGIQNAITDNSLYFGLLYWRISKQSSILKKAVNVSFPILKCELSIIMLTWHSRPAPVKESNKLRRNDYTNYNKNCILLYFLLISSTLYKAACLVVGNVKFLRF